MNVESVDFDYKTELEQKQKIVKKFLIKKFETEADLAEISVTSGEDYKKEYGNLKVENFEELEKGQYDSEIKYLNKKRPLTSQDQTFNSGSENSQGNYQEFNTGRWTDVEHKKFLEAILIYGNEWKKVQKYISTRSSTQARSHAQKFFLRLKKNFRYSEENLPNDPSINGDKKGNILLNVTHRFSKI
jgi:hypothetical protein